MPPKKNKYNKRRRNKKRKYVPKIALQALKTSPLPTKLYTTMRYTDQFTLDHDGVTAATHVLQANGLTNPSITTGLDHQPSGFDELIVMYDHYTVINCKIQATFSNRDNTIGTVVGVTLRDTPTAEVDARTNIESGNTLFQVLTVEGGSQDCATLSHSVNSKTFTGRKNIMDNSNLTGSAAANPTEGIYWHLWSDALGGQNSGIVDVQYVMEYRIAFTEPKAVGLS